MKKIIAGNIIFLIVMFLSAAAHADALSTSKTIRVTVIIPPEPIFDEDSRIIDMGLGGEKEELQTSPDFASKAPQRHEGHAFFRIVRMIKNFFSSFAKASKDTQSR